MLISMIRKQSTGQSLIKKSCEICGFNNPDNLHLHHIIPRTDKRSSNNLNNLACICPTCHSLTHTGDIIIIGVYTSTAGRMLMFFKKGEEPPIEKKYWKILPEDNLLVLRKK